MSYTAIFHDGPKDGVELKIEKPHDYFEFAMQNFEPQVTYKPTDKFEYIPFVRIRYKLLYVTECNLAVYKYMSCD